MCFSPKTGHNRNCRNGDQFHLFPRCAKCTSAACGQLWAKNFDRCWTGYTASEKVVNVLDIVSCFGKDFVVGRRVEGGTWVVH